MQEEIWFRTVCRQNGVDLTNEQLEKLEHYARLLLEWNKTINLVSRRDEENLWISHLLHSASMLFKLRFPARARVLDLGTGGGLPGIPLKILLPQTSFTLLDSTAKKIKVVQHIIQELSLQDTTAVWGRAEDVGLHPAHHKRYDIVVARGVGSLRDVVRWSFPFLKGGERAELRGERGVGRAGSRLTSVVPPALAALKGGDLDSEIRSAMSRKEIQTVKVIDIRLRGAVQLEEGEKKIVLVNF